MTMNDTEFDFYYRKVIDQYQLYHLLEPKQSKKGPKQHHYDSNGQMDLDDEDKEDLEDIEDIECTVSLERWDTRYMPPIEDDTAGLDPTGYNKYTLININEYVPDIATQFPSWFYFTTKLWRRQKQWKLTRNYDPIQSNSS